MIRPLSAPQSPSTLVEGLDVLSPPGERKYSVLPHLEFLIKLFWIRLRSLNLENRHPNHF